MNCFNFSINISPFSLLTTTPKRSLSKTRIKARKSSVTRISQYLHMTVKLSILLNNQFSQTKFAFFTAIFFN